MSISKDQLKQIGRFELADPETLDGLDEWVLWLEAMLHGPCHIFFRDGGPILLQGKQLVDRLAGLRFEIYPDEHSPPHFHVSAPELNASFAIEDCRLLAGHPRSDVLAKVRYWHKHSKHKLIEIWNATRPTDCQVGPYSGA
jgi:hypothetical protein